MARGMSNQASRIKSAECHRAYKYEDEQGRIKKYKKKRSEGKVCIKNMGKGLKTKVVKEKLQGYYFYSQVQCSLIFEGSKAARSRELHLALNQSC